jgi:hypothetical protein
MLPPVLLLAFARDSHGYGIGGGGAVVPPRHRPSPSTGRGGGRSSASSASSAPPTRVLSAGGSGTTSELAAGLRDLVGPYDEDYSEYGSASSPSVRDERNSVFAGAGFGGGGGGGGAFGRRNSPGFLGFRGDRNYPNYDVVIDAPSRSLSSTSRGAGTRIFDNVAYGDLLPGSRSRSRHRARPNSTPRWTSISSSRGIRKSWQRSSTSWATMDAFGVV